MSVVERTLKQMSRHAVTTTSRGMTPLSFPLYSETPPADRLEQHKDLGGSNMDNDSDNVGGYAVPVDPMDLLQCDSCQ